MTSKNTTSLLRKKKVIRSLLKQKLAINRGYGHASVFIQLYTAFILTYVVFTDKRLALLCGAVGVVLIYSLGMLDLRAGVYAQEQSISNDHNPELQMILRATKRSRR